jgi:hypothetical protein
MNVFHFAIVLLLVSSSAAGEESDGNWVLIRDFTRRVEAMGVSILPPRGQNWYMKRKQREKIDTILFRKQSERLSRSGHSIYAAVQSMPVERLTPYSRASIPLLERLAQWTVESVGPPGMVRIKEFSGRESLTDRGTCFRYRAVTEEYEDPPGSGSRFVSWFTGLECFHPDAPRVVSLTVGQRIRAGTEPRRLDGEVEGFLEFLQFKPLSLGQMRPPDSELILAARRAR